MWRGVQPPPPPPMGQISSTGRDTLRGELFLVKKNLSPSALGLQNQRWRAWDTIRNTKQELGTINLCIQPLDCLVTSPEARSAALHRGPLWDEAIDIPIHRCQTVSHLCCPLLCYGSENPLHGPLYGQKRGIRDSRTGKGLGVEYHEDQEMVQRIVRGGRGLWTGVGDPERTSKRWHAECCGVLWRLMEGWRRLARGLEGRGRLENVAGGWAIWSGLQCVAERVHTRCARHPNQCSGHLSQCFTPKHHSLLQPRLSDPCCLGGPCVGGVATSTFSGVPNMGTTGKIENILFKRLR